jgi:hypothetical protein
VPGFLDDLRAQLKAGTFRPLPVRKGKIPKSGGSGKSASSGYPAMADRLGRAETDAETHSRGGLPARVLRVPADAAGRTRSPMFSGSAPKDTGECWTLTSRHA